MTPDSECGEMIEYVRGQEPASLLGSCSDGKTCREYRWDAESDPSISLKTHCEEDEGARWSVGMCPQEMALEGCRAIVFYERCRSMTTSWVLDPSSLENEKKRCSEIHGEVVAGHVAPPPPPVLPDP